VTIDAGGLGDLGGCSSCWSSRPQERAGRSSSNPFDQPNVQEAKNNTARALAQEPRADPAADEAQLRALVAELAPPRYFAVMGYLPYSEAVDAAVGRLRAAFRAATTYGYGPRFLHPTGQLHKGGPATGVFRQLVHEHGDDVDVPGKPHSFARLIDAHADGDLAALRAHDLPVARVRLAADDLAGAIDDLAGCLR
jgi:transaldolase / glucose-6-phosphate isomerase